MIGAGAGAMPQATPGGASPFPFIVVASDPSVAPGRIAPVGTRAFLADGTAAWDKSGTADTDWTAVGGSVGPYLAILSPSGGDDAPIIAADMSEGPGIVFLLPGHYRWRTPQNLIGLVGVKLIGSGAGATIIEIDDSAGNIGDALTFTNSFNCGVEALKWDTTTGAARTAGNAVVVAGGSAETALGVLNSTFFHMDDVDMQHQFKGVTIQDSTIAGTRGAFGTYINRGWWRDFATTGVGLSIATKTGASNFAENLWIANTTGAYNVGTGFSITATGDFTLTNCETWGLSVGLLIKPGAGQTVGAGQVNGGYYDASATNSCQIATAGGHITHVRFSGVWFAPSSGVAAFQLIAETPDQAKMIQLVGCNTASGLVGFYIGTSLGTVVSGCSIDNEAGAMLVGIEVATGATGPSINGNRILSGSVAGIQIDAGATGYMVTNNNTLSAAGASLGVTDSGGAVTKLVTNNL